MDYEKFILDKKETRHIAIFTDSIDDAVFKEAEAMAKKDNLEIRRSNQTSRVSFRGIAAKKTYLKPFTQRIDLQVPPADKYDSQEFQKQTDAMEAIANLLFGRTKERYAVWNHSEQLYFRGATK